MYNMCNMCICIYIYIYISYAYTDLCIHLYIHLFASAVGDIFTRAAPAAAAEAAASH